MRNGIKRGPCYSWACSSRRLDTSGRPDVAWAHFRVRLFQLFPKATLHPRLSLNSLSSLLSDISHILSPLVPFPSSGCDGDVSTRHTGVNTRAAAHSANLLNASCALSGRRPGRVNPAFPLGVGLIRLQPGGFQQLCDSEEENLAQRGLGIMGL